MAKRIMRIKICVVCGNKFATKTSRQTCSRECASLLKNDGSSKDTICWRCRKATTSECSWADKFIPVEGWKAIPTKINTVDGRQEDSFNVRKCPLYEKDGE